MRDGYNSLCTLIYSIRIERDTARSTVVIWVNIFETELMVEIYSKSLVRTIGKVLRMTFT